MKFSRILGECDPKLVSAAEEALSNVFLELSTGYDVRNFGSGLGGDVFIHQMVATSNQVCDARDIEFNNKYENLVKELQSSDLTVIEQKEILNHFIEKNDKNLLRTAATNGHTYFWNPAFITKLSKIGLRLAVGHEAWHTVYMHPSRRGNRLISLWNKAVDFKTNFILIDDLRCRKIQNPEEVFRRELGDFVNLTDYAAFLRNPFDPPTKLQSWNPIELLDNLLTPGKNKTINLFYAEPNLSLDLRQPEAIYDYLLSQVPKCNKCGKLGVWNKPARYSELEQKIEKLFNNL